MRDRILVTGGTGLIGRCVISSLRTVAVGAEIHVASRQPRPASGAVHHSIDLLAAGAPAALIDAVRPTRLIHLAWTTEHDRFWHDPTNVAWIAASTELFEAFAETGGMRILATGSCAEYDWTAAAPYGPDSPTVPATPYGAAKLETARRLDEIAAETPGLTACWARLFHLYGPGEHRNRLIPALTFAARCGEPVSPNRPDNVIDLMHTADAGRAIVALTFSDVCGALNVASGVPVRLADVADAVCRVAGREPATTHRQDDAVQCVTADVTRLLDEADFRPIVDLTDGLTAVRDWWHAELEAAR